MLLLLIFPFPDLVIFTGVKGRQCDNIFTVLVRDSYIGGDVCPCSMACVEVSRL